MATSLTQTIQEILGFPVLKMFDPNTDIPQEEIIETEQQKLAQAAIPAALITLYKYIPKTGANSEEDWGKFSAGWENIVPAEIRNDLAQKVSLYAGTNENTAANTLQRAGDEALRIMNENKDGAGAHIKEKLSAEKNNILLHLPAALHTGDTLRDNTIDDVTKKMEGPLSSMISSLGNVFSQSEREK